MSSITAQKRSSFWLRLVPQSVCSPADITVQTMPDVRNVSMPPNNVTAAVTPEIAGAEMVTESVCVGVQPRSAETEVRRR